MTVGQQWATERPAVVRRKTMATGGGDVALSRSWLVWMSGFEYLNAGEA
jgi:hypothetical protein